jgi:Fe-S cluster assembly protein SufD
MADTQTYVAAQALLEAEDRTSPSWLKDIRAAAIRRFAESGFPSHRDESWRFTHLRPLLSHDFASAAEYSPNGLSARVLDNVSFPDTDALRLVFVNGQYAADLSPLRQSKGGLEIDSLRRALDSDVSWIKAHLAKFADVSGNPFVALNTSNVRDGAVIRIPKGHILAEPVHLLFVSTKGAAPVASHPRVLIVAESGAQATIIESYVSYDSDVYFTNAVTEIVVGESANINHHKLQRESERAYHVATVHAQVGANARFKTDSISLGGALVRNDVVAVLDGEFSETTMNGLYMGHGHQHVDNHTVIEHVKPNCVSHELYKGILTGRAKAVFNGRIHVHPDAQKTDAKQSNRCLLLSEDAQVNTNPQLEIYADDVKCTHGAAVGQLDENAVFYLQSRGIAESEAKDMLVYAFANSVIDKIKLEPIRDRVGSDLFQWLGMAQGR